jgi:hypothetical protein
MVYVAKRTFAHGKKCFRKGEPVTEIKGREKLLSLGLIMLKAEYEAAEAEKENKEGLINGR